MAQSARSPDDELVGFGPFTKGVSNRLDDYALPNDTLRQAVNVWVTDTGRLKRRTGYESIYPAANAWAMFATEADFLFAAGTSLYRYDPDSGVATVLRADLAPKAPIGFTEFNGEIFYSTATVRGRCLSGEHRDWGIAQPGGLVSLASTTGALPAGTYGVVTTFKNAHGEESGCGLSANITTSGVGGIAVSNIPQPSSAEVTSIELYRTNPNGDIFFSMASLPVGATSYSITSGSMLGRQLRTQFMSQVPNGIVLAAHSGAIYSAYGKNVFYTEPLSPSLCRRNTNWITFPEDVQIMASVGDGLYVVADKTYFLRGANPAEFVMEEVLPFGGAYGSLAPTQNTNEWVWYSDRGQVKAGDDGRVVLMQDGALSLGAASVGASLFYETDGMKQIISLASPKAYNTGAAVGSFIDMEVRRKTT